MTQTQFAPQSNVYYGCMQTVLDRISPLILKARAQHARSIRSAAFIAVLIGLLLWQTQWPSLGAGLVILLLGQLGTAILLLRWNSKLLQELADLHAGTATEAGILSWFDGEQAFNSKLKIFENGARIIGCVVLAYGFWVATRNLWIPLAFGVLYPAIVYLGIARRNESSINRKLRAQKQELASVLANAGPLG